MRNVKILIMTSCAIITMTLVGCAVNPYSSVMTDFDRDASFKDYETYYWSDDFQAESGKETNPLLYNTLVEKRLKSAIEREMDRRGYRLDKSNPDLLINSHVVAEEKSTIKGDGPLYPYYYGYYPSYYGTVTTEQQAGGLIIEIIDKDRRQLIWQGYTPDVFKTNTDDKQKEVDTAVAKIFSKYNHMADQSN